MARRVRKTRWARDLANSPWEDLIMQHILDHAIRFTNCNFRG